VEDSGIGLSAVGRTFSESVQLFEEFIDYRKEFERKNRNLNNLAKQHVTSEIVRQ
jgi:hypothetical protein